MESSEQDATEDGRVLHWCELCCCCADLMVSLSLTIFSLSSFLRLAMVRTAQRNGIRREGGRERTEMDLEFCLLPHSLITILLLRFLIRSWLDFDCLTFSAVFSLWFAVLFSVSSCLPSSSFWSFSGWAFLALSPSCLAWLCCRLSPPWWWIYSWLRCWSPSPSAYCSQRMWNRKEGEVERRSRREREKQSKETNGWERTQ